MDSIMQSVSAAIASGSVAAALVGVLHNGDQRPSKMKSGFALMIWQPDQRLIVSGASRRSPSFSGR